MLFNETELSGDFGRLELEMKEKNVILDEGPYHQGEAEVITLVGIKK
jgi:hypothetical protein